MELRLDKDSYRPDEVSQLLGVHVDTIRRYLKAGQLTATGAGMHRRIPRESIVALLQASRHCWQSG